MLVKKNPIRIFHHNMQKLAVKIFKVIKIAREAIKHFFGIVYNPYSFRKRLNLYMKVRYGTSFVGPDILNSIPSELKESSSLEER